jgi:hypothetical protein
MVSFNPLDHPICLRTPLRLTGSTWIEHVPFGMYIIDILRPKVFVELGTLYGVSYCAFCQAVQELKTETKCFGIDTWKGDENIGNPEGHALEELRSYHDPLYRHFSELIQSTFDEALGRFEDGTIDLLHIDGFHSYDAVRRDFENWLPKLTSQGVILFHDIMVREEGFGVWKLWEELKPRYPHFDFFHGYGLGLLAVGENSTDAKILTDLPEEEAARVRNFFASYGSGIMAIRDLTKERELYRTSLSLKIGTMITAPFRKLLRAR